MTKTALLLATALALCVWGAAARPGSTLRVRRPSPSVPVIKMRASPPVPRTRVPRPIPVPAGRRERIEAACLVFHDRGGLVAALASDVEERRCGALGAIRFLGLEAAPLAPELAALVLAGSATSEVFEALEALGPHAAPAVVGLIAALRTPDRDKALDVLMAIGPAAAEARFAVLAGEHDWATWRALTSFGPAAIDVAPQLVPLLQEDGAARALVAIDPDGDSLEAVRASDAPPGALAELFGAWGVREEIPRLLRWLEVEQTGWAAATALVALDAVEAGPALLRIAHADPSPHYVEALAKLRPDLARQLIPVLVARIEREEEESGLFAGNVDLSDFTSRYLLLRLSEANRAAVSLGRLGTLARDVLPALEPRLETVPFLYDAAARIDRRRFRDRALRGGVWGLYPLDALELRCGESLALRLRALEDWECRADAAWSLGKFEELPVSAVPALLDALPLTLRALGRVKQLPASCAPRLLALDWDDPEHVLAAVARLEPAGRTYILQSVRR